MRDNVTLPLGSIAVTDKIESNYVLISGIFGKAGGKHTFSASRRIALSPSYALTEKAYV
ncbi:MAG: hypothetical protein M1448_02935 [Candidatus Marsarchaeota archaeon]|nr:hypothetical protein [Candidatus Marsarchaeota archaeon]